MERQSAVKDKIVAVAGELFYKQGYNLTGINQIIEEADIAKASLYSHFPSKTDLLLTYLQQFQEEWFAALDTFVGTVKDPKKKILALFDFRIQRQELRGFGGCPFIKINDETGTTDDRILQKIQENKDRLKEHITDLVKATKHKQLFTNQELVQLIYLALEGGTTSASIYKDTADLKKAKNIISKML